MLNREIRKQIHLLLLIFFYIQNPIVIQQNQKSFAMQLSQQTTRPPLIDSAKIKLSLLKKLNIKSDQNPEQILAKVQDELTYQIQKTTQAIDKQLDRQHRIQMVLDEDSKSRHFLREKLNHKIQKSTQQRQKVIKQKLDKKIQSRKIKDQLVAAKKKQIKEKEFKERLDKYKEYQSANLKEQQNNTTEQLNNGEKGQLKTYRSVSQIDISLHNHLRKSKQLEEYQYYKTMERLAKRKLFDKPQKPIKRCVSVDKTQEINNMRKIKQNQIIQKVAEDMAKIEEVRLAKSNKHKEKLKKNKLYEQIHEAARMSKLEEIKKMNLQKLKERKELLNMKNQRYANLRNLSTPNLNNRKQSYFSQRVKTSGGPREMTESGNNFKLTIQEAKVAEYLEKQRKIKEKNMLRKEIARVLNDQKRQILLK